MDVVSHCPLPVAGRLWRPRAGAYAYTFVCKATFALAPGKLALAPEQQPVHEVDRPWSDTVTSLYAAADLAPHKPRADVVLIGSAYAPGGAPVKRLLARLAVGEVDKSVEVWCDRTLRADGSVVHGPPFSNLPLLYERAAGGPGTDNPVGIAPERDAYGAIALPNLAPPGARVGLDVVIPPAGFGPIAARWPSRLALLGRSADETLSDTWQDRPLPPDLDMAYFNVAPEDQQPPALKGDERILLENLHPSHPRLAMALPGLRLAVKVSGPGGEKAAQVRCDTLWIDTSREICCLTYRGQVLLASPAEAGWVVVTLDDAAPEEPAGRARSGNLAGTATVHRGAEDPERPTPLPPRPRAQTMQVVAAPEAAAATASRALPASGLPFQAVRAAGEPSPLSRRSDPGSALPFRTEGGAGPSGLWSAPSSIVPLAPLAPVPLPLPPPLPPSLPLGGPPVAPPSLPPLPAPRPPPVVVPASFDGGSAAAATAAPRPPASDSPWATAPSTPGAGTIAPVAPATPPPATPGPRPLVAPAPSPRAAPAKERTDAIDLLFFNPEGLPRIRRVPAWKPLLAALEDRPLDPDDDDPSAAKDPIEIEDRREVLEILLRAEPSDAAAVDEALGRGMRDDGRFVAPVLLLAGEIATPFDEIEALKATVATVTPLAGNDENVRASLEVAKDFLKLPSLSSSPAVAEGLATRVRDAFNQGKRAVPPGYVDAQTERALVEQRAYQKRTVLGGKRVRALVHLGAEGSAAKPAPMVAYLAEAAAPRLPMHPRFKARIIVRAHPGIDPYETSPVALEVLALARLCPPPRMTGPKDGAKADPK